MLEQQLQEIETQYQQQEQMLMLLRLIARQTASMAETIEMTVDLIESVLDEVVLVGAEISEGR